MAEALAQNFSAVAWAELDGQPVVRLLDQRALPTKTVYLDCVQPDQVASAIRTLSVRGAPAIGIAAAYGVAQSMVIAAQSPLHAESYEVLFDEVCKRFAATRPTAVNLFWAIDRMRFYATTRSARSRLRFGREALSTKPKKFTRKTLKCAWLSAATVRR